MENVGLENQNQSLSVRVKSTDWAEGKLELENTTFLPLRFRTSRLFQTQIFISLDLLISQFSDFFLLRFQPHYESSETPLHFRQIIEGC